MRTELLAHALKLARLSAVGLAVIGPAAAQVSPWYVGGALSLTHDDNLLRLGETQTALPGQSRSDTVTSASLTAGLDQPFGRQRVQASLALRDNRFARNDRYNNQSYSGSASLDWSTVNRISGQVGIGRSRALSTFNADVIGLLAQRNFETSEGFNASVSVGLVTAWSLELSAGHRRVRNSIDVASVQAQNLDQDNAAVGVAWRPGAALETTLAVREVRGRFPTFRRVAGSFEDDAFTQRGVDLGARWQASGSSLLDARIGTGQTQYLRGGDRDFDSISGSLGWNWRATGKLSLSTRLAREKGQDNYPTFVRVALGFFLVDAPAVQSDLRTIDTLRAQLDWAATAKTAVSSSVQLTRRDVASRTRTVFDGVLRGEAVGTDETTIMTLGARWAPYRWSLLGCDLRHETRRSSGNVTSGLKGTSLGCYAQATMR
jgi:hypothetical protein